jgi:hypothetical protein
MQEKFEEFWEKLVTAVWVGGNTKILNTGTRRGHRVDLLVRTEPLSWFTQKIYPVIPCALCVKRFPGLAASDHGRMQYQNP